MKPLNLRNYLLLSLKQVTPQILMLSIKIALFIFLCSIGFAVSYGIKKDSTMFLDQYISIKIKDVSEERYVDLKDEIRQIDGVEDLYRGRGIMDGLCKLIVFNSFCWTVETDMQNTSFILNSINGKLIVGEMPNEPGEMLISEQLSKSLKKKVGDFVGQNERISKPYIISGIYQSEHNVFIGYAKEEDILNTYIIQVDSERIEEILVHLDRYSEELIIMNDRDNILSLMDSIFQLLTITGIIIILITVIEVTISVSNLNKVYFTERAGEFALLQAVGYKEKFILKRLIKELSIFISVGLIMGILIGQLAMSLFYYLYCFDEGIPYRIFEPGLIVFSLILAFLIFILSYIPIKKFIRKMDWVEVIAQQSN